METEMSIAVENPSVPWIPENTAGTSEIWGKNTVFEDGSFSGLIAPSGRGKTTFIQLLYGLIRNYSGEIIYGQINYASLNHYRWSSLRTSEIAVMFQDLRLFENLSGLENIQIKNRLTSCFTEEEILEKAGTLGIGSILNRKVLTYSLGEKQRCAFLRTLCQPFKWILLDEPYSHVDEKNIKIMYKMLSESVKKNNAGIIAAFLDSNPAGKCSREYRL